MKYLHTMVRVTDVEKSLDFYCNKFGLEEIRRIENEKGRFTLIFLAAPKDKATSAAARASAGEAFRMRAWVPAVASTTS